MVSVEADGRYGFLSSSLRLSSRFGSSGFL